MPDPLRVLGFDTSAAHCAAAVVCGGRVLAERAEPMTKGQAERLFPLLEELLAQAGLAWSDLDAIGVGIGPGNFTGVRISVAAARGLSLSLGIPAIGVSATEAAACDAPRPCRAVVPLRGDEAVWEDFGLPQEGPQDPFPVSAGLGDQDASDAGGGGPAHGTIGATANRLMIHEPAGADIAKKTGPSPDLSFPDSSASDGQGAAWPARTLAEGRQAGESRTAGSVSAMEVPAAMSAVPEGEGSGARAAMDACEDPPCAGPARSHDAAILSGDHTVQSVGNGPRLGRIDDLPAGPPVCIPLYPVAVAIARVAHEHRVSRLSGMAGSDAQAAGVRSSAPPDPRPAPLYLRPADAAPPRDPPPVILR